MNDRAAVYTVRVGSRTNGRAAPPLGDLDGNGASLMHALQRYLDGFVEVSKDGTRVVRALATSVDAGDLFARVEYGQRGIAAEIDAADGSVRLLQTPDETQFMRCGCLFRLPLAATAGWLAIHINAGRGTKELLAQGLSRRFNAEFPGLRLTLDRFIESGTLKRAVLENRVDKLRLIRLERPDGHGDSPTEKWLPSDASGRLELDIVAVPIGTRLQTSLIQRFLDGDDEAFAEIVEFGSITFDAARVGVSFDDGTRRTFNLANPDAGRPLTRNLLRLQLDDDGAPTDASLVAELKATLETVGG